MVAPAPVVIPFQGELTIKEAPRLREVLLATIRAGAVVVVVDLAGVTFLDQTAIGVVIGARNRLLSSGGDLRLAAPQAKVTRVIDLLGLGDDLPVFPTVAAALEGRS